PVKDTTLMRDRGDSLASVILEPAYSRAWIEAYPVLYIAQVRNVPTFSVQSGVVRAGEPEEQRFYRPGAVAVINLPPSGKIAYGAAFGFGVSNDNKISL